MSIHAMSFAALLAAGCAAVSVEPPGALQAAPDMGLAPVEVADLAALPPMDLEPVVNAVNPDLAAGCANYTASSIAGMRRGGSGCFQLEGVVTLAVTPVSTSTKSVTLHAQDAAGGDFSAIRLECSSTSASHPCAAFATVKNIQSGRKISARGLYLKSSAAKGGYETFELDDLGDEGAGTAPSPAPLAEVDLRRAATLSSGGKPMAAYWFQVVSANLGDKLLMFDWSPPEFQRSGSTACPQWFGFALIPTSAGATAGAACSGAAQPGGPAVANSSEVLIGTDYFDGFTWSTDCACAAGYHDLVPTAGQGVSGSISALLDYEVPYGQTTGYQYLAPLSNAAFTIH